MVQQAMGYIDQTPDIETRIELIKTLNNVSAGKVRNYETDGGIFIISSSFFVIVCIRTPCVQIYVEIERARLTKKLAKIKEEQGQIAEAADLMQEVAVSFFCLLVLNLMEIFFPC